MTDQASGQGQGTGSQSDDGTQSGGQPQGGSDGQQGQQDQGTSLTPEQIAAELARARQEAARYRNERNQYRDQVSQFQQANMTEQERAQARIRELEQQVSAQQTAAQEARLEASVTATANRLGFRNPGLAVNLLNRQAVEFDADGKPTNVEALLAEIAKAEPYLLRGQGGADGGQGREDSGTGKSMNDLIRHGAGRA